MRPTRKGAKGRKFDPSKPLGNFKWERFAQEYVKEGKTAEAYQKAFTTNNMFSCKARGYALLDNSYVAARVNYLVEQTASTAVLTLREKREFLARVIRTPVGEVDSNSDLCQKYKQTTNANTENTTIEVWMCDKLKALELDAKITGEFAPERFELNHKVNAKMIEEETDAAKAGERYRGMVKELWDSTGHLNKQVAIDIQAEVLTIEDMHPGEPDEKLAKEKVKTTRKKK